MLATRIIPTLLHRGTTLVKGKQFNSWRSVGNVQQAARVHAMRGVDELCILDIGATPEGRGPDFSLVEKLTEGNFTPITIGGGVRTVEDVKLLLRAGADKVVIGTAVCERIEFVRDLAEIVGAQAIAVAIDYRITIDGRPCLMGDGGTVPGVAQTTDGLLQPIHPVMWAKDLEILGAGEIILTSIDREGMMEGYDLEMIAAVSKSVSIPVIAHGGCGTYQHMLEAIQAGASAVAAGSMFQFTDQTPKGAAQYLAAKGIEVRL